MVWIVTVVQGGTPVRLRALPERRGGRPIADAQAQPAVLRGAGPAGGLWGGGRAPGGGPGREADRRRHPRAAAP
eukprot:703866-Prorocentrum_minimum.AAC.1